MKFNLFIICIVLIGLSSCDPEPSGPETDCRLNGLYKLDYHAIEASKAFDLRSDPPLEIRNGTIEYDLSHQSFNILNQSIPLYPYSEYFIDTIEFLNETNAIVKILERDFQRLYTLDRNDCQLSLNSPEGELYLQLTSGGDEISEKRFAIYNHSIAANGLDTFLFIEFRTGPFKSYEDIISQFSKDNPGMYDTVAVEQIYNRTKE